MKPPAVMKPPVVRYNFIVRRNTLHVELVANQFSTVPSPTGISSIDDTHRLAHVECMDAGSFWYLLSPRIGPSHWLFSAACQFVELRKDLV
jgi:hypothetical protein